MHNEIGNYIENAITDTAQQQGINFSSHREAQQYIKKSKSEIRRCFREGKTSVKAGLIYFKDMNDGFVSAVSGKLLKHLNSSKKFTRLIESEITNNDQAMPLFMEAIHSIWDRGDVHAEQCVITALMGLFPMHPQPYIHLGTLIWRKEGIDAAEAFYAKVIVVIEDPALDYFAADCFYKKGNIDLCKELLKRAWSKAEKSPEIYSDIQNKIILLFGKCL
jgi:tetratricopeptide (TPR) repeat protein